MKNTAAFCTMLFDFSSFVSFFFFFFTGVFLPIGLWIQQEMGYCV